MAVFILFWFVWLMFMIYAIKKTDATLVGVISVVMGLSALLVAIITSNEKKSSHYFVVKEFVQCQGHICNAVLDMNDIAILLPYDTNKVKIGDKLYLKK